MFFFLKLISLLVLTRNPHLPRSTIPHEWLICPIVEALANDNSILMCHLISKGWQPGLSSLLRPFQGHLWYNKNTGVMSRLIIRVLWYTAWTQDRWVPTHPSQCQHHVSDDSHHNERTWCTICFRTVQACWRIWIYNKNLARRIKYRGNASKSYIILTCL